MSSNLRTFLWVLDEAKNGQLRASDGEPLPSLIQIVDVGAVNAQPGFTRGEGVQFRALLRSAYQQVDRLASSELASGEVDACIIEATSCIRCCSLYLLIEAITILDEAEGVPVRSELVALLQPISVTVQQSVLVDITSSQADAEVLNALNRLNLAAVVRGEQGSAGSNDLDEAVEVDWETSRSRLLEAVMPAFEEAAKKIWLQPESPLMRKSKGQPAEPVALKGPVRPSAFGLRFGEPSWRRRRI